MVPPLVFTRESSHIFSHSFIKHLLSMSSEVGTGDGTGQYWDHSNRQNWVGGKPHKAHGLTGRQPVQQTEVRGLRKSWTQAWGDPQRRGYIFLLPVLCREGDHVADADTEHAEHPRGEAGSSVQEVC